MRTAQLYIAPEMDWPVGTMVEVLAIDGWESATVKLPDGTIIEISADFIGPIADDCKYCGIRIDDHVIGTGFYVVRDTTLGTMLDGVHDDFGFLQDKCNIWKIVDHINQEH